MAKTFRCNNVIPGCPYAVTASTEEDLLRMAAEHARLEHNIRRITPEISAMMRAAVREESGGAEKASAA